jgi:hypothetical protein
MSVEIIFEFSISIDAPREDVFDLLADLSLASRVAGAPVPKMLTEPPITVGTRWLVSSLGGQRNTYSEIVRYDRPNILVRQLNGYAMDGIIEDVFEPTDDGTKVTRKVNVKSSEWRAASLKSQHIDYFESMRVYLERKAQRERDDVQSERDAQDPAIIAAERARIRGQTVPKAELTRKLFSNMKHSSLSPPGEMRRTRFARKGYEHARVVNSGPGSSGILSFLFGPIDLYITCLSGRQASFNKKGVEEFCHQAIRDLTGRFKRTQIILPVRGHEEIYWEDAVSLLEKPELDNGCRHVWSKEKCFLIITHAHPAEFNDRCFPLVSIDITDILPSEVRWVVISLGRLCARSRFIPFGMAGGYGKNLFEQELSHLPGAGQYPREESALDILSLPVLITPSMSIDFKYFREEIRTRFESICEETLTSQPGALPFKTILKDRLEQRRQSLSRVATLPEERSVREFWD